ncbi:hypothetical protein PanWU01x14_345120 [Parasponia andersonii]|uniref:Uncharacterized protein n=1 Tax=Parasponia andersonii TaxID=3476 RepID=A0A2P5ACR7_PARAD|nr:hypothetical protein PanWU01x14_345120 [Parasponia andersonii]
MQYKLHIQTLKKKWTFTMREYLIKMKHLTDVLASVSSSVPKEDHILYVLFGLGNEYEPVVVSTISRVEPYTLKDVRAVLQSCENRLGRCSLINTNGTTLTINLSF